MGHNYCLMMAGLAADGRAVVHYDQIGCGGSTHLSDVAPDFWTVDLSVDELRSVVEALGVSERFHLLGQSWGGMLAPEVVLADPSGIQSLTICDSPASMDLWLEAANALRAQLPDDVKATLTRHEEAGSTDSRTALLRRRSSTTDTYAAWSPPRPRCSTPSPRWRPTRPSTTR